MSCYRGRHRKPTTLAAELTRTRIELRQWVARRATALTVTGLFLLFALIG